MTELVALDEISHTAHLASGQDAAPARTAELEQTSAEAEAERETGDETIYPRGIRFVLITFSIIFTVFLSALDSTIISTAIPSITDEFGHLNDVVWYSSAYSLTNFAFLSSWGKAYKYFPLKQTFIVAGLIFEIGNVVCATATSSSAVILGRAISGTGGGGIMSGGFTIIALTARPRYRAAYMGIVGATFGCSGIVGPLLGGILTDQASWRWCFWISLPIWATGATGIMFSLQNSATSAYTTLSLHKKLLQMDFSGSLLACASMTCFITAMHWGGVVKSWSSGAVVGCLVACAAFAGLFILNERLMGDRAMIQGRLLKNRVFVANLVYEFFLAGLYFPLLYSLPIQFQSIDNVSAAQSGIRLIPLILGISIFTMISNGIISMYRKHLPLTVLGAAVGTIGVGLIYGINENASTGKWIGYEIITAVGIGLVLQVPMVANQALVSSTDDIPEATALTLFFENMGTTIFNAATEAAFTSTIVSYLADNAPSVDASTVISSGAATQLRGLFTGEELQDVLSSYMDGCKVSHAMSLACGGLATAVSLVMAVPVVKEHLRLWMKKKSHVL
ncbi:hypothetical protein UA08_00105 [Talaromyces atroroseus]|uniref:Major facilitator superfamily (MFS) profile domain-containing protein n=1 Tax=Talaromyces atroroseus TaxID=1441469 RepID=A0A225BDC9_TALAT|nr:hypothetical protein UA08_00105 [Talaromyces atroroseus]OKL64027.1 hypothetical protein UA08_00105 [Talaromyces atroroseus]